MSDDTNITATVIDSDGTAWAGAQWTATIKGYIGTKGPTYLSTGAVVVAYHTGFLDSNGALAVTLAANDAISPFGTSWELTIQPLASVAPSVVIFKATGAAMDISAEVTEQIKPPRVAPSSLVMAQADGQIQPPTPGFYVGVGGLLRYWDGQGWSGPTPVLPPNVAYTDRDNIFTQPQTIGGGGGPGGAPGYLYLNGSEILGGDDDSIHINPLDTGQVFLSWDSGGGVTFGDGAGNPVGSIDTSGNLSVNGGLQWKMFTTLPDGTDINSLGTFGIFVISNGAVNAPPIAGGDLRGTFVFNLVTCQLSWCTNDPNHLLWKRFNFGAGFTAWGSLNQT